MSNMSREDILEYMEECGAGSASGLLLLVGPDSYEGAYNDYKELADQLDEMEKLEAKVTEAVLAGDYKAKMWQLNEERLALLARMRRIKQTPAPV